MKSKFFYGYVILVVIFVLQVIMFGAQLSFGVFIKPITAEFDWPRALVAGAFSISTVMQAFSAFLMGWLNDRIGPRVVVTICSILIASGLALMYTVHSIWQLYLFYGVLVGMGGGGLLSPQISTIARWFVKRRNMATAVLFAGGGVGGFIGPPVVTWLIYTYSWRQAFLIVSIALFVLVILGAQFLRRDPSQMGQLPDGNGTQTLDNTTSEVTGNTFKEAFRTRKLWFFSIAMFCIGFCLWTFFLHIVPFSIDRGISPAVAAMILSVMSISQPVGSIVVSLIADRIGNSRSMVLCICLLFAVTFLLLPVTSPWLLGLFVIIMALGLGGTSVLQSSMSADLFGMKAHGAVLGFSISTFAIGSAVGTYLGGLVYDLTGNYQLIILLCVGLVLVATVLAIFLNRMSKTESIAKSSN